MEADLVRYELGEDDVYYPVHEGWTKGAKVFTKDEEEQEACPYERDVTEDCTDEWSHCPCEQDVTEDCKEEWWQETGPCEEDLYVTEEEEEHVVKEEAEEWVEAEEEQENAGVFPDVEPNWTFKDYPYAPWHVEE